jgi:hypothetical protein
MTLPTPEELNAYDMAPVAAMFKSCPEISYLYSPAGIEHYRLLRWIGEKYVGKSIYDIGTYMGLSAGCFAYSGNNSVWTFDTSFDAFKLNIPHRGIWSEIVRDENCIPVNLLRANIIFVDTWHNGFMEHKIYNLLIANDWKGILIYDDIYYNDAMKAFWAGINHPGKIDATNIGHSTGTGIIEFI